MTTTDLNTTFSIQRGSIPLYIHTPDHCTCIQISKI
jgi:hypothetical protein